MYKIQHLEYRLDYGHKKLFMYLHKKVGKVVLISTNGYSFCTESYNH